MTDKVAAPFWGDAEDRIQFFAGHTFGGNPVACSAALASIDYIVRHGVLGQVRRERRLPSRTARGAPRLPSEHPPDSGPRSPAGHRVHRRSAGGQRGGVHGFGGSVAGAGSGAGPARSRIRLVRGAGPAARVDPRRARRDRRDPGRRARRRRVQGSASRRDPVRREGRQRDRRIAPSTARGRRSAGPATNGIAQRRSPDRRSRCSSIGSVPGADLYGGVNVLAPGAVLPVHWHSIGELQFILSGTG